MSKPTTPTAITAVRDARAARSAAEVAELVAVVAWAAEFRVEDADGSVVTEETFGAYGVLLGGVGCPLVDEFDAYDLAAGLSMSSESGCHFIGRTLELRYRLRRMWERVVALQVPVWKAFKIADATVTLVGGRRLHRSDARPGAALAAVRADRSATVSQAIDLTTPRRPKAPCRGC